MSADAPRRPAPGRPPTPESPPGESVASASDAAPASDASAASADTAPDASADKPTPTPAAPARTSIAGSRADALARRDPDVRGTLTVADRVVERIAARVARDVPDTASLPRRLADRMPGRQTPTARASVTISGRLVQLELTLGVAYPVAVREVTRAVREQVRDTVGRLCDMDVRDVDIRVTTLRRPEHDRRVQ